MHSDCHNNYFLHTLHEAFIILIYISFRFLFEPTEQCPLEYCNMFTISQAQGTLSPTDRPSQVAVSFQSDQEVHIKDQPILRCQVIEPSLSDSGETIASIPIKLSVRSVFSKLVYLYLGHTFGPINVCKSGITHNDL